MKNKIGEYGYLGASATTLKQVYGELGNNLADVFSTGYGDGLYPVYANFRDEGRISSIIIDFMGDLNKEQE
jgi:hypothetical protein